MAVETGLEARSVLGGRSRTRVQGRTRIAAADPAALIGGPGDNKKTINA